jgi:hypothetical protein
MNKNLPGIIIRNLELRFRIKNLGVRNEEFRSEIMYENSDDDMSGYLGYGGV